jgi:hypothetical protein
MVNARGVNCLTGSGSALESTSRFCEPVQLGATMLAAGAWGRVCGDDHAKRPDAHGRRGIATHRTLGGLSLTLRVSGLGTKKVARRVSIRAGQWASESDNAGTASRTMGEAVGGLVVIVREKKNPTRLSPDGAVRSLA